MARLWLGLCEDWSHDVPDDDDDEKEEGDEEEQERRIRSAKESRSRTSGIYFVSTLPFCNV